MDQQYAIVNHCLQLTKQSDIPTRAKLRVEISLLQMKRLLLDDTLPQEARHGACCVSEFEDLLCHMRRIYGRDYQDGNVEEILDRIDALLITLVGNISRSGKSVDCLPARSAVKCAERRIL